MSRRFKWIGFVAVSVLACAPVQAQTAKEQAEEIASIEKAKADALEAQLRARTAQLSLDQAERKASLELEAKEQEAAGKQQAALATAAKGLSDMSLKGAMTDVAVSGNAIETSALTYRTLRPVADQIVKEISDVVPDGSTKILLADETLFSSIPAYQVAENSLKTLSEQFKGAVDKATAGFARFQENAASGTRSGAAFPLIVNGITALASVAQTFKTQMSVVSSAVTIDPLALQAALAHSWIAVPKQSRPMILYPGLNDSAANSDIGAAVNSLSATHDRALELQSDMKLWLDAWAVQEAATAAKAKAAKGGAKKAKEADPAALAKKQAAENITALSAQLKAIDTRVMQVLDSLNTPADKEAVSPLIQLIKTGFSVKEMRAGVPVLTVKVVAAGGNSLATNNLWTGAKLFHSGGAVIAYQLLDKDGSVLAGNVLDAHTGYVRMPRTSGKGLGHSW